MLKRSCIHRIRSPVHGAIVLLVSSALCSCALAPPPSPVEIRRAALANVQMPGGWRAGEGAAGVVENGWLATFADKQLEALVDEALLYNADLHAAAARVEQAAGYARVAGGQLYPSATAIGRGGTDDSGDSSGLEGALVSAAWEIDVWGRVRYGVRGARDQHAAAHADYVFARASLAALVAKSWFLVTTSTLEYGLVSEMVAAANELLRLAESRQRVGVGSDLDVASARTSLQTYRDNLLQAGLAREQSIRALELLLGRYPATEILSARDLPALDASIPAGMPAELLERRPDVMAAERRVGAAFNLTQQARAARLPRISLTGSGSDLSSDLFVLKDRNNPAWRLGGEIFAPLFTGGALRAQVSIRTAEQKEAIASYASTALAAIGDVENSLANERTLQARESTLASGLNDAELALRLAQTRYRVGAADLRDVQQQQLAYHAARLSLLQVQSERRIQRVNLHLGLGGDFAAGT
jgi:multidrug efflux system outer membrane protein